MVQKQLHQVVNSLLVGDATSDHVLLIRQWLREMGFISNIYASNWDERLASEVLLFDAELLQREPAVIVHHAIGSQELHELWVREVPLILIYHNITPPHFYGGFDLPLIENIFYGRQQLEEIRPITRLALSDSPYSEEELLDLGFEKTGVLPIVLDESQYDLPLDEELINTCRAKGPLLLFVGRIAPHKRQEDLIKLLYYYRRIEPRAHLALVGSVQTEAYDLWLKEFVQKLGLEDAVTFTGHVTQLEMVSYYKAADLYVSMSEHEGFGKPLIESMFLGLPLMAYASTAVPSTLGGAGIIFDQKDYEALAELVDMIVGDENLRRRLIAGQKERVQLFLEPSVKAQWQHYVGELNIP